jgi:hypothetical protein
MEEVVVVVVVVEAEAEGCLKSLVEKYQCGIQNFALLLVER